MTPYQRAKRASRVTPRSLDQILANKEAEKFPELEIDAIFERLELDEPDNGDEDYE